jgi:hypothetical protein
VKGWQTELALSLANSGLGQRQALTSAFIVIVNLFSFTPRFTNVASRRLVIGDWGWS